MEAAGVMSDEAPAPQEVLLTSSDGGGGVSLLTLGLLGGGVALIAYGMKGRKDKKESEDSESVEAKAKGNTDEVVFGKDLGTHQIGASWREEVLGPYLEDAAEERTLTTRSWAGGDGGLGGSVVTSENVSLYMDHTRDSVLKAFYKTHTVKTTSGEQAISALVATPSVLQFKSTVEEWTKQFQETF